MDSSSPNLEHKNEEAAARLAIFDRLMRIPLECGDDLERMAQAYCVAAAETFGDLATITILNRHNELMHMAGLHDVDPQALTLLQDVIAAAATTDMPRDRGLGANVIRTGEPLLLPAVPSELLHSVQFPAWNRFIESVGLGSIMIAPLRGRSGNIGSITLGRHTGGRPYDDDDLELLTAMCLRISMALENTLLVDSLRAQIATASSIEAALSASEDRFRSLFESTTLGVEIMDPLGTILDTNPAFQAMTGYSRAELLGRRFGELQHPDGVVPLLRVLTELRISGNANAPFENRIVRRDGTLLWVRTDLTAMKKGGGDEGISFIIAVHEDITGRKKTEQYFQAVLEATPDALVMVDAQGRIMLVNRQMERMFGYSRNEILGQDVEWLVPDRMRNRHPLLRNQFISERDPRRMASELELYAVAKDGTEIPVEINLSPLDMDGTTVVVAALRDITDRKKRREALERSQRSLAEAQRVAHLGSLEFDMASGSVEASDEALRIFGIARDEYLGRDTILERTHPGDRQQLIDGTRAVLESRLPRELEFRVIHPDGSIHIVHDRVAVIPGPDGEAVRLLGTVRDVTEQRQIEREMTELKSHLQSSAELERLRLAQDLHDGPMQELYGASYRLEEISESSAPDLQEPLRDINKQIQGTIHELRDMAKELRPPSISSFGLEKAIRAYVEDFQDKHPNINLHLSLAQDRQLLPENMRLTLFRVFQQALTNVLRHSRASEVRVRFTLDAEEVRLVVSDNGAGFDVPPNWMSFVRQGHYGLAGAAERVSALGGILLVESRPEEVTTVTAIIPWSPDGEQTSMAALQ